MPRNPAATIHAATITCPCCAAEIELRPVAADARKVCQRCRESLPVREFGVDRSAPGGIARRCKACDAARKRAPDLIGTVMDPDSFDDDDEEDAA